MEFLKNTAIKILVFGLTFWVLLVLIGVVSLIPYQILIFLVSAGIPGLLIFYYFIEDKRKKEIDEMLVEFEEKIRKEYV